MRNRFKSATDNTRRHIDTRAADVTLPPVEAGGDSQMNVVASVTDDEEIKELVEATQDDIATDDIATDDSATTDNGAKEFDDSWLNDLTPYEDAKLDTSITPPPETDEAGTEEQQQRLAELYSGMEHVEEEVADEVYGKLVKPDVARLEAQINRLDEQYKLAQQARLNDTISTVNKAIFERYPKAEVILRSKEFKDFLDKDSNPYASDKEFDILMRAYYAGDADYVVGKIDKFAETRGKPKPPVGVEPQQGGGQGGVNLEPNKGKAMTDEEYMKRRRIIKSAPRGTYPPNALKNLVMEYENSRGTKS